MYAECVKLKNYGMKNAKTFIKQAVGIDVSKDTLEVCLCALDSEIATHALASECFQNNPRGINRLTQWISKNRIQGLDLAVIIEATGVYHERMAYHLHEQNYKVIIVLPGKMNAFFKSTNKRTIHDKISARLIAEFGLTRKLDPWTPPTPILRKLKGLVRERTQLLKELSVIKNRKHAMQVSNCTLESTLKRNNLLIKTIQSQIKEIEQEIKLILKQDPTLHAKIKKICTIKGVALITAVSIIAETDGFSLIRNAKQLVCYAGYDVVKKESGTSVKKGGSISHKGNKYIRKALYFPAITAKKHLDFFSGVFERLFSKHNIKGKAYVAIQRKLLILIYTLWKNNEVYIPEKHKPHRKLEQPSQVALSELDHCPLSIC